MHAALRSLEARKTVTSTSRGALLNAAEVLHGPSSFVLRSVANMLSGDGRCKTFDATADGYIRGEGAGALLLKPLEGAEEGRCRRLSELRAVVMNQDGKSATLTAPNGPSQEELLVMALREAQLTEPLAAVECRAAQGQSPRALGAEVMAPARRWETPSRWVPSRRPWGARAPRRSTWRCLGGAGRQSPAVEAGKSNHGHLEGAAGFAGLMKAGPRV